MLRSTSDFLGKGFLCYFVKMRPLDYTQTYHMSLGTSPPTIMIT